MKTFVPNYYADFACIAGQCRHSCCIGWEIDIDSKSLARFQNIPGALGRRLKENIILGEDGAYFRLGEHERCPFLNGEGLCDLILELGEDALCQICADHPRFRNFFSDRTEIGLGLCCEAAGRLILSATEKACWMEQANDEKNEIPDEDEEILLQLRGELTAALQDRSLPLEERIRSFCHLASLTEIQWQMDGWTEFLLGLERLDEAWSERLREISGTALLPCLPELALPLEQFAVYLLMRHLPGALEDGDLTGRCAFVLLGLYLVNALCAAHIRKCGGIDPDNLVEAARMFSSEIEYSDENISAILDELHLRYPEL